MSLSSHQITLSPSSSMGDDDIDINYMHIEIFDGIPPKKEPENDEPILQPKKMRAHFRNDTDNLINHMALPPYSLEYLKVIPPPPYVYFKKINGDGYEFKYVYLDRYGDRYIYINNVPAYLKNLKGLYKYHMN